MWNHKSFIAELIGTFLLVFFGCGSVVVAVALGAHLGLVQVAIVWGLGLSVAIYITASASGAHLNPAITIAAAVWTVFPWSRVTSYILAQCAGAFLAAVVLYVLFNGGIAHFEQTNDIVRGEMGSEASAMVFGEYFPNPGGQPITGDVAGTVTHLQAFLAEFLGTTLLAMAIFAYIAKENSSAPGLVLPIAIGMTLTVLICTFAPLSQAGFNPARDLMPRIFSSLAGWGSLPFTFNGTGWLTVYIIGPVAGAIAGGGVSRLLYKSDG